MKLFEFEAKNILKTQGIAIPEGRAAASPNEAAAVASEIGKPVAVKAQVLVSGRGKAGGIVFANSANEAKRLASDLIGKTIRGIAVKNVLVEEKLDIVSQYYASITIDRQAKTYVILASVEGGVDIEETASRSPEKIIRYRIDPIAGFDMTGVLVALSKLDIGERDLAGFVSTVETMYRIALDKDAELVEINPLVKTTSGGFVAADARMIIDDNALFRHPEFQDTGIERADMTAAELEARKQKLNYVDLPGDIGIIGNGAGLVMATIDLVQQAGGSPANFLDLGGTANTDVVKKAIMLVMTKPAVKKILVNVLGGITRCDVVANAVVQALNESPFKKPIFARLMGTNEAEGARILQQADIKSYRDMETAIKAAVDLKS